MANTYNANAVVQALADATAMDANLKGDIFSRVLDDAATQHNAFEQFTSTVNAKSGLSGGIRSIFAKKQDLAAGGASVVNFNVIGTPGGPGVIGNQELTGNTSKSLMATYGVRVGWFRDGFELDREALEFLSAGRSIVETTVSLLAKKMGILRQNIMMMRLIKSAKRATINTSGVVTGQANYYRPNSKATLDSLASTDVLSLSMAHNSRARVRGLGATPISHKLSGTGSPIDGYMMFASDQAMLPIRNDSSFITVQANSAVRGNENSLYSGELLNWGGMPWYEFPIIDEAWDDYIGNPLLPKAKIGVAVNAGTTAYTMNSAAIASGLFLRGSTTGTDGNLISAIGSPRYFQFFDGYDYLFTNDQPAATNGDLLANPLETGTTYYAWACNPDGTYAFLSFVGSDNKGTYVKITNILSQASGIGVVSLGNLSIGVGGTVGGGGTGTGTRIVTTGTDPGTTLTAGWNAIKAWLVLNPGKLVDKVDVGAIVFQANASGNIIGRGFVFGAMAACFANGRINMNSVEQTRDFGFTVGKGFETIFGAGITKTPNKVAGGYLVLEHVVKPEGYNPPSAA